MFQICAIIVSVLAMLDGGSGVQTPCPTPNHKYVMMMVSIAKTLQNTFISVLFEIFIENPTGHVRRVVFSSFGDLFVWLIFFRTLFVFSKNIVRETWKNPTRSTEALTINVNLPILTI